VLRFLLGAFEAGFFPGIILYLAFWYPPARRGQMIAIFMAATTIAGVIAGPLCGGIMKFLDGVNGWHGWQWLFLVQGVPASILGTVAFFSLQDKPQDAHWLRADEKRVLSDHLEHDAGLVAGAAHGSFWQLLRDPEVYSLPLVHFLLLGATYTMVFWVPTLIKGWGIADLLMIGLYAAVPNIIGVIGMVVIGRSSDRRKERRWHFFACTLIAAGTWD
jgi:MFS family permease